ncbi:MAG TPA: glycosyl hydrolase family 28-related protein, partial [Pyrinomonadaceae bacterium]|nr:glycosyl hydrolase family 28-related protein [Pyrinomonadaceae bacterium]
MSPYSFRFRALILTALLFLLVCTATVNATTITISSKTVPNIQWGGTTATLRIYSSQNFMASDGTPVLAGTVGSTDVYLPISCTISGTTLTVPSFTLQSTLDGADRTDALYTAVFYDSRGNQKSILLGNFAVPATPATTTWDALAILNRSQPGSPGETYSTTAQVRAPFNGVLPAPKASDGVAGMARVSVPPVSSSNPIAVGDNDRRLLDLFNVTKYPYYATPNDSTDDTAAIQAAITAAGGMPVYIPPGQYKITSGLNNSGAPITLWNESAVGEDTNQTNVPVLNWYGAAGGTMLAIRGANYIKIQGIAFEGCPTGTGGADAAISIDTPAGEAKVIIDSCLINFNGVRSTFKAISLSPTASANNENITIRNTYIKASNTFSLAASRGSAIYMGNNSQSDVVVFDHVWLRACNVALRTYGQNITIRDSFIDTSNVGISIGSGDLTVDRVHS